MPPITVRAAEPDDVDAIAALFGPYMREAYDGPWHGSAEALRRDAFGGRCEIQVAVAADGRLVGFLAYAGSYDLHHCVQGADGLDMYVAPEARNRGVAPALVCAAARAIHARGGVYLRGGAVERGSAGRLYARMGVCDTAVACTVGGRAFRRLAELAGRPPREVARGLPERAWNYEA
jgi:GNAT superfamily N-acetyltransferase